MKMVSFYHRETGALADLLFIGLDDLSVALNTPKDHIAIDGHHDHLSKRFDIASGKLIDAASPASADAIKNERAHEARGAIQRLEAAGVRAQREMALGRLGASARLLGIDDKIAKLRQDL